MAISFYFKFVPQGNWQFGLDNEIKSIISKLLIAGLTNVKTDIFELLFNEIRLQPEYKDLSGNNPENLDNLLVTVLSTIHISIVGDVALLSIDDVFIANKNSKLKDLINNVIGESFHTIETLIATHIEIASNDI